KNPFNALPFNGLCVLDPTQGLAPYPALPVSITPKGCENGRFSLESSLSIWPFKASLNLGLKRVAALNLAPANWNKARTTLETRPRGAHIGAMDNSLSKIEQLVADARIELKRLGIDTEGKRSDELLNMVSEARNPARAARRKLAISQYPSR